MNRKIAFRRPVHAQTLGLALSVALLTGTTLQAQNWTGATSEFWNIATNWSTGALPTASQVATFDTVVANPAMILSANMTLDGLYFTGNASQNYTLNSFTNSVLTLDGGANNDIQIDAESGAHTILSDLTLTGTHSWTNASSNAFTVAGNLNHNTASLTLSNAGTGGWVLGSTGSQITNQHNGDLSIIVGDTGAEVDLTLNGQVNITSSSSARTFRLQAAAGSVVNINAVLASNDGSANRGGGAFAVSQGGTVNLNVTKTYTNTTTINHNTTLNVNAAITNGGTWDIDGGTLNWNVTNTNMGALYFGGGPQNSNSYLNIADGVVMNLNSSVVAESEVNHAAAAFMHGGTVNLNATGRTVEIRNSNNTDEELTITSTIADGTVSGNPVAGGITKTRQGTLVLAGNNTYTGVTNLNEGGLILDYRTHNGNKISSTAALTVSGGFLWMKGNANANTSQTVGSTTINSVGATQFRMTGAAGYQTSLNLGAITRANTSGGMVNFQLLEDNVEILTSNTNSQSGILGSWATVTTGTGDYYATVVDGKIKALNEANFGELNSQIENHVGKWQTGANVIGDGDFTGTSNQIDINSLRISGSSTLELADSMRVQSGGILISSDSTSAGIMGGNISLGANSNNYELKIHQASNTAFEISSGLHRLEGTAIGHVDLTKSGSGELILSGYNFTGNRASTSNSGTVRIAEGTLTLSGGRAISDQSTVQLDNREGAQLKLLGDETIGALSGGGIEGGYVNLGEHTLTLHQLSVQNFNGAFIGSGTLIKQVLPTSTANSNLTLNTSSSTLFTGHVVVNQGALILGSGSARSLASVSTITVNKNGSFLLDANGSSTFGDKINNNASILLNSAKGTMSAQITFRGLAMRNDQEGTREEVFGSLILQSGANYVTLEGSKNTNSNVTILRARGIERNHQSTLAVRGTNLGAATNQRSQLLLVNDQQNAFRTAHLTSNTGAAGTSTMAIVRWAIGQNLGANILETEVNSVATNLQLGNSLVTYINNQGFRALSFDNEYATLSSATNLGTNNVRESLVNDMTGITSKNLHALVINNSSTSARQFLGAGADSSLNLESGTLLFTALQSNLNALPTTSISGVASGAVAYGVTFGGFDQGVTTGSGEYIVFQNNLALEGVTISSDLTTAAAFTKSGLGTLTLTGNNTALTDVALNEGVVQIQNLNQLGGADGKLIFGGGTLKLLAGFTGDLSTKQIMVLGETHQAGNNSGKMGTLDTNGVNVTLTSSLTGNGEFVKTGIGTLTLAGEGAVAHQGNFVVEHTGNGSQNGAMPQLILNRAGGNAIGGNLQIGTYAVPAAKGSAAVELARGEQIVDTAVISFNGSSDKNAYFSLKGFTETVAGIRDTSTAGVLQSDVAGGTTGASLLILAGDDDYYFNGYLRNRSSGSGTALNVTHSGTGRQTFSGNNINYSGLTTNTAGTLGYRSTTAFNGNIHNEAMLEFEQAGTTNWNYAGVISGSGHLVKLGEGTATTSLNAQHTMTGSITVKRGELTLGTNGKIDDASMVEVYSDASFKTASDYTYYGKVAGTGAWVGNLTLSRKAADARSAAELRPGASTHAYSSAHAGSLLGHLQVTGDLTLTGGSSVGDDTGARAILQVGAATLNDAAGIALAMSQENLIQYLNVQAANTWNQLSLIDSTTGVTKHDGVTITGTLTWNAGSTLRIEASEGFAPVYGDVFDLFDWGQVLAGTADSGAINQLRDGGLFGDLFLPVLGSGLQYDLSAFATHGLIAVVPEPSRFLSLAGAMLLMHMRRRRRN